MSLAKKLNLKEGVAMVVFHKPEGVDLGDVQTTTSKKPGAVLVFVKNVAELEARGAPLVEAAREDRIAWAAYPKAGKLGTDLNRDVLWEQLKKHGIEPVRQVALDDVWSAMRFRPAR